MSYEKFLSTCNFETAAKPLSIAIKKWKEEGDAIIGKLVDQSVFEGGKFAGTCNKYTFLTDNGLISCILGAASDKIFNENHLLNRIIFIKFHGKVELEGGKTCNTFSINDLTEAYNQVVEEPEDKDE